MKGYTFVPLVLLVVLAIQHPSLAQDVKPPPRSNTILHCDQYLWSQHFQTHLCTLCTNGYFLDASGLNCVQCADGCARCATAHTCLECSGGYFMKNDRCTRCLAGCWQCNNEYTCQTCKSGHYLADNGRACNKCGVENCHKCTNGSNCQECNTFYKLETDANSGKVVCTFDGNAVMFWVLLCGGICAIFGAFAFFGGANKEKQT